MTDEESNIAILRSLQDSLIEATAPNRKSAFIGTHVAMINPNEPLIYYNYAVPVATPNQSTMISLIEYFHSNDRVPRFEFFPELWPNFESILIEAGFDCESKTPVMVMGPNVQAPSEELLVREIIGRLELIESSKCSSLAFEREAGGSEAEIKSNVVAIQAGNARCAGIWEDGRIVSNGWTIGGGPICELAGVGTHPEFRKLGYASKVSSYLCRRHFENGGEYVWLSAGSPEAEAVYSKLGFRKIGVQANYCLLSVER